MDGHVGDVALLEYFGNNICVDAFIDANNKDNEGDVSSGIIICFDR